MSYPYHPCLFTAIVCFYIATMPSMKVVKNFSRTTGIGIIKNILQNIISHKTVKAPGTPCPVQLPLQNKPDCLFLNPVKVSANQYLFWFKQMKESAGVFTVALKVKSHPEYVLHNGCCLQPVCKVFQALRFTFNFMIFWRTTFGSFSITFVQNPFVFSQIVTYFNQARPSVSSLYLMGVWHRNYPHRFVWQTRWCSMDRIRSLSALPISPTSSPEGFDAPHEAIYQAPSRAASF